MAKFKFAALATFWSTVKVTRPDGEVQEFEGQFVYLDDKAWISKQQMPTLDFLREHWTGWHGIVGEDDREIPFGEEQREDLLKHTFIAQAVVDAYIAARQGQRAKN